VTELGIAGRPVNKVRLLIVLAVIAALFVMAWIFLPARLVRLGLFSLVLLPFIIYILDRPSWIFYFLFFILCSNMDVLVQFRIFRFTLLLFMLSFAIALLNGRRLVIPDRVFLLLVTAFLLIAIQSTIVVKNMDAHLARLSYFVKMLINIAVIFQFVRDRREFRTLLIVYAIAILVTDLLPFIKAPEKRWHPMTIMWGQGVLRYEGYAMEPNGFAMIQNLLIPILLFLFAVYKKPKIARPLFLAGAAASLLVLVLSFSRGGFVGLVAMIIALLIVERRNRTVMVTGFALIIAALILAPGIYWERISSIVDFDRQIMSDYSIMTRIKTMEVALKIGLANPVLGVGLENFIFHSSYYVPFKLTVHNAYLQVFAETGFPGFIVFIGIIIYNLRILGRMMRRSNDPEAAQLGRLLLVQQVAILVNANFIPATYDFWLWFALSLPAMADIAYRKSPRVESAIR
jgi:O-antigen ligase